jgi:hypothetical protein
MYAYDGNGRRVVKTSSSGAQTVYVYDAGGELVSEYSIGTSAPPCTTCYLSLDHLGSTRLVTDQAANIVARHDYLPFGEEIAANTGGRDSTFGTQDFVNQKFTGKERDQETGLDYFGARDIIKQLNLQGKRAEQVHDIIQGASIDAGEKLGFTELLEIVKTTLGLL